MHPPRTESLLAAACTLAATLLFWAPSGFAEQADRDQPINLEADRVTVDDASQITTFAGSVRLSQGSLLILGDTIIVTQEKRGSMHIVAHGKTASFRQKRETADGYVEGYGERIEYDTTSEILLLDVQARLKRHLDEVTGEHITYNAKTDLFRVNVGKDDADAPPHQRVRVVLQPKPKPGEPQAPEPKIPPVESGDNAKPVEPR